MSNIQHDLQKKINDFKGLLDTFNDGSTLAEKLESIAKHVSSYEKIVKSHISQLNVVLGLDAHGSKSIEQVMLAKPLMQLMDIFKLTTDEDIKAIEELAAVARNWNPADIEAIEEV